MPTMPSGSSSDMTWLPLACELAGLGDSPVQSPYPSALFGVHNLLGVVARLGFVDPSTGRDSRFV
jgi:hypothetical protein